MNKSESIVFANLFKDACKKCFGIELQTPLTESESNLFSAEILKRTGLVIGWKSLKNYSYFVVNVSSGKHANPSVATLDTLCRFLLDAPYTDEVQRKEKESHYPYWFKYKAEFYKTNSKETEIPERDLHKRQLIIRSSVLIMSVIIIVLFISLHSFKKSNAENFIDNFNSVSKDSLIARGWLFKSINNEYWNRRGEKAGCIALYTLRGDNWPDSVETPNIQNLLLRKIYSNCFTTEIHLMEFVPRQNWQQAGIILMEDTNFSGKSLRLSLGYNDFSGGFPQTKEIIMQAIYSSGNGLSKPEEIIHKRIFTFEPGTEHIIAENLENSALRIEKRDKVIRLYYSAGQMKNSAFIEAGEKEFDIQPKYIGLFALKGFTNNSNNIPAYFNFFSLINTPCDN